jgi:hypothetical protein
MLTALSKAVFSAETLAQLVTPASRRSALQAYPGGMPLHSREAATVVANILGVNKGLSPVISFQKIPAPAATSTKTYSFTAANGRAVGFSTSAEPPANLCAICENESGRYYVVAGPSTNNTTSGFSWAQGDQDRVCPDDFLNALVNFDGGLAAYTSGTEVKWVPTSPVRVGRLLRDAAGGNIRSIAMLCAMIRTNAGINVPPAPVGDGKMKSLAIFALAAWVGAGAELSSGATSLTESQFLWN